MLHARLVTSPLAHADIVFIDGSEAMKVPGVVAVITAAELPKVNPINRGRLLLARDRVIFTGQPVAVVLAEDETAALDGAEKVLIDYSPLPTATTMEQALSPGAPLVWPLGVPSGSDEAAAHGAEVEGGEGPAQEHSNIVGEQSFERGDVEVGFAAADELVEYTFKTQSIHQSYLEPQATIAQIDQVTGGARIWTSTQAPFWVREEVAAILGLDDSNVEVVAMPTGGAFGGKFVFYQPLVALLARHSGRPVRLALTRLEEMAAGNPAHPTEITIKIGGKRDGSLTALQGKLVYDAGCFPGAPAGFASYLIGSIYQVPNVQIEAFEVLTFKPSSGAYRAPGAPQATFALESALDELARKLDVDPLELRLANASVGGDSTIRGRKWATIGLKDVLATLRSHEAYEGREEARAMGRGIGIALGGWFGGTEPSAATCILSRDGRLSLRLGLVDLTGTATTMAILAADAFGIDPDLVDVRLGHTGDSPYAGAASGSKITYTVGPSVIMAAKEARRQTLEAGADLLDSPVEQLDIVGQMVQSMSEPGRQISLKEIGQKSTRFGSKYAPIIGTGRHADNTPAPGFAAQLAEVEVDRETGEVEIKKLVIVQDVGRVINPLTVEGQIAGAVLQGLGWALYEEIEYSEDGQLLSGSWSQYTVPRASHTAKTLEIKLIEVASDGGPVGARGVGEPPVVGTAAAVSNAIADAIGLRLTELPMTPQRIKSALDQQSAGNREQQG